jgi:hypothetical protein
MTKLARFDMRAKFLVARYWAVTGEFPSRIMAPESRRRAVFQRPLTSAQRHIPVGKEWDKRCSHSFAKRDGSYMPEHYPYTKARIVSYFRRSMYSFGVDDYRRAPQHETRCRIHDDRRLC